MKKIFIIDGQPICQDCLRHVSVKHRPRSIASGQEVCSFCQKLSRRIGLSSGQYSK